MKKNLLVLLFLAVTVIFMSAVVSRAQITGGYGDVSKTDTEVRKAAAFAVKTRSRQSRKNLRLIDIEKAQVQVVAGLNYDLCMRLRDGKRYFHARAVVYKDLKNRYSLTSWKRSVCTE